MEANGLLVFLTDFGTRDWYAASMKGAAMAANPEVKILDITHDVSPGSIAEGAFVLDRCFHDFPPGTVFVGVVDPGVGTNRNPIAIETNEYFFVGPDNGILYPALANQEVVNQVRIETPGWMGKKSSRTFHGRDIFAPAGARIAAGHSILDAGPSAGDVVRFEFPQPEMIAGNRRGGILYFDRFGNGFTNLLPKHVESSKLKGLAVKDTLFPLARTFGEVDPLTPVSYWGSSGFLELAIREGNAMKELGLRLDATVRLVY